MNWLKWVVCWWHGRHVMTFYRPKEGTYKRRCVRCGHQEEANG